MWSGSDYAPSIATARLACKCFRVAVAFASAGIVLAIFTLWLIAIAPRDRGRPRTYSVASLSLLAAGVVTFAAAYALPVHWFNVLFFAATASMLFAVVPAAVGFFREEGKLAAAAIGLSLAFPTLVVAGLAGCAATDGCFH
jgi:hypothetical protein